MEFKPFLDIAGNPIEEGDICVYRISNGHGPRVLDYGIVGEYEPVLDMLKFKTRGRPGAQVHWLSRYRQVLNITKMNDNTNTQTNSSPS